MARDFYKNTARYVQLPAGKLSGILAGSSVVCVHARINYDTASTASNDNRLLVILLANSAAGIALNIEKTGANALCRVVARSTSGDSAQSKTGTTALTAGVNYVLGGRADFPNDTIATFTNGVKESEGAVTFANTSWTNGSPTQTDGLGYTGNGAPASTASQVDGRMAEIAIWRANIGDGGFFALANNVPPNKVKPESLVLYLKLDMETASVIDYGPYGVHGIVTGALPAFLDQFMLQRERIRRAYELKAFESAAVITRSHGYIYG